MKKKEAEELLDNAFEKGKKLLQFWHDRKLDQIRLKSANIRRFEESKQAWRKHI